MPTKTSSMWFGYIFSAFILIGLSVYLGILTKTKFRRIKEENDQFKKIKILTSNYTLEVSDEFADIFKA